MARNCDRHPDRVAEAFCVKCGASMCPECERPYGGRPFCPSCVAAASKFQKPGKAPLQQAQTEQPDAPAAAAAEEPEQIQAGSKLQQSFRKIREKAGGARGRLDRLSDSSGALHSVPKEIARMIALLLDSIVVLLISLPLSWMLYLVTRLWMSEVSGFGTKLSLYVSILTVSTVYFVVTQWRSGRTLGKAFFGLKVTFNSDGGDIPLSASIWRWIGFLAALGWSLAGLWIMSGMLGWLKILRGNISAISAGMLGIVALSVAAVFSLGLLITFVGKHKRGFHDLLGGTIVARE
jgi:uncharacterized RDD family membrane protein YckC